MLSTMFLIVIKVTKETQVLTKLYFKKDFTSTLFTAQFQLIPIYVYFLSSWSVAGSILQPYTNVVLVHFKPNVMIKVAVSQLVSSHLAPQLFISMFYLKMIFKCMCSFRHNFMYFNPNDPLTCQSVKFQVYLEVIVKRIKCHAN